jgi:diaminopimelate decarboxylase
MNHFHYRHGELYVEDVALSHIADQVGTPFYCYSTATLTRHYQVLREGLGDLDALICFAVKSNSNIALIRTLGLLGAGADVVSEGEMRRALAAGIPPERIVFSGVGKTRAELAMALDLGILQINVESEPELLLLNDMALERGKKAVIGLRVNPDVDAHTHAKITTGRKENKFGIEWIRAPEVLRLAHALPGIQLASVAIHIGSQLTELAPFRAAFLRLKELVEALKKDGITLPRLDLGGGLGVPYEQARNEAPPLPAEYGALVREVFGPMGCALLLEPGRLLVGNAGTLISQVLFMKKGESRDFVICDAAMNDLVRPAMYDAHHDIRPVNEPAAGVDYALYDVVGPVCETGDTFARQRPLPPLAEGDLIAFATAGAYGATMSSTYNSRPLVPEVLVKGDQFAVVRARPSYEQMFALESVPEWVEQA